MWLTKYTEYKKALSNLVHTIFLKIYKTNTPALQSILKYYILFTFNRQ